ncbi:ABC transporter substrate-binding protein [Streptomyces sp. V4I2]|uniref:ABC transporter substrate-binding protein n=1 Tax=Streptomyces sp. V4I2 TaxID=3042280 RepID=UPI002789A6BA|nr:ABC transporter substrate-binding protein [Streptomyces sp. V4I2]MDQ1043804.1 glycine betaine/proline transport system substrate-binding protein [Streptomyces sp. V4I2]
MLHTHNRQRRVLRTSLTLIAGLGLTVAVTGCGAADTGKSGSAGSTDSLTLTVPSWVGAEANVAVAKYVLETELDYKVNTKQMGEVIAWDALSKGTIDAVLEDWGHPKQEAQYVDKQKTVVSGGDLGVTGHIGWFVPKYWADANPEVTTYKGLNKYAAQLKTSESGGKGQLLEGSPDYVTFDDAIIGNLDLDLKTVYAGSEAAQITQIQQNYKAKKPFLTYWWTPQWLNAQVDLVEVKLPEYKEGCDADPKKVACAYPNTPLQKWLNADFAKDGGKAAAFLKNFKWTADDQNEVAKMITQDKLSADEAAKKWVTANPDAVKGWLA